jgi:hypothetical protein
MLRLLKESLEQQYGKETIKAILADEYRIYEVLLSIANKKSKNVILNKVDVQMDSLYIE